LLAFRKLALSSELDALRGIGIGYGRLLRVPYMFALGLLVVNIAIVGWVDPMHDTVTKGCGSSSSQGRSARPSRSANSTSSAKRMTLRIDRSEQKGTRLMGIFTALDDRSGTRIAATAAEGQFLSTDDPDTIIFRLKNGRLVQDNKGFAAPRTLSFESYDLPINLPSIDPFRGRGNDMKELVLPELVARAYGGSAASAQDEIAARANLHFRLVEIAMMLMLPMLAIALAIPPKRSSSSLGIFVGIVMVVTYHK
jgi:lipopolysaccharide export system permease protein